MKTLKKFLYLLSDREKKHAYLLLVMILAMALLDMLGVASIMPFIAVLSNPEIVEPITKQVQAAKKAMDAVPEGERKKLELEVQSFGDD